MLIRQKKLTRQIQKSYYDKKFSTEYDYTVFMERLKLFSKVPLLALLIFLQNSEEYFTKPHLGNLRFSLLS